MQSGVSWTFRKRINLNQGHNLLLLGNIYSLGQWNPQRAITMNLVGGANWEITLNLNYPVFQYKYMIQDPFGNKYWEQSSNIYIDLNNSKLFQKQIKLMSFNVRYDNSGDKQFSWKHRRDFVIKNLFNELPTIIGIQQALKHQKQQLVGGLNNYYEYYGIARDLKKDEQCGIFYLRHKFRVHGQGMVWFNETRTPGIVGYGANLPRNLTYLVLQDAILNKNFLVINTHLDHESQKSQAQSVKIIVQTCQSITNSIDVDSIFIMGDFNVSEHNSILAPMKQSKFKFASTRLKTKKTDNLPTFHDFKGQQMMAMIAKGQKGGNLIDHIFYASKNMVPDQFKTCVTNKPYMSDHYPICAIFKPK